MKVLIICTGNSCRSPMAEYFLRSFDGSIEVISAGAVPETIVSENAVMVMKEALIDLSNHVPKNISLYTRNTFNLVISIGEPARNIASQYFSGKSIILHLDIEDPGKVFGSTQLIMDKYRYVRDEIKNEVFKIYIHNIKPLIK